MSNQSSNPYNFKITGPASPFIAALIAGGLGYYSAFISEPRAELAFGVKVVAATTVIGFVIGLFLYWNDRSKTQNEPPTDESKE